MRVELNCQISESLKKEAESVAAMRGMSLNAYIRECIDSSVAAYRSENGKVEPREGLYLGGYNGTEKCHILKKTIMYGRPYLTITMNGQLLSVPESQVRYT